MALLDEMAAFKLKQQFQAITFTKTGDYQELAQSLPAAKYVPTRTTWHNVALYGDEHNHIRTYSGTF